MNKPDQLPQTPREWAGTFLAALIQPTTWSDDAKRNVYDSYMAALTADGGAVACAHVADVATFCPLTKATD